MSPGAEGSWQAPGSEKVLGVETGLHVLEQTW